MKCKKPHIQELLGSYQMGLLDKDQELEVDAHLLECESCFQEVYKLRPVIELFEEMPERFKEDLQSSGVLRKFTQKPYNLIFIIFSEGFNKLINWFEETLWIKILAPIVVVALIILLILPRHPDNFSDLAVIEKAPYLALKFKGTVETTPSQKLFLEGMKFYEQDNFAEAIQRLSTFLKHEPNNAFGHFYLGVSLLLQDEIKDGIEHLGIASDLSKEQDNKLLLEKCYWNLGNAYLKVNDADNALRIFRLIIELQGDFISQAEKQIKKIEKIKRVKVDTKKAPQH